MKNIKLMHFINIIFLILFIAIINIFIYNAPEIDKNPPFLNNGEADEDWALFLINTENPLSDGYTPALKTVYKDSKDYQLDIRCADFAIEMFKAAEKEGISLAVCSAYRSFEKQEENFSDYVEYLIKQGYSEQQAIKITEAQIAYPGESEHNAGLSMDIVTKNWFDYHTEVNAEFENTKEFKWLIKNSYKYGFIMRYPQGGEYITGFDYEPWHYRFVGADHAEQIYYMGITLEEYLENFK